MEVQKLLSSLARVWVLEDGYHSNQTSSTSIIRWWAKSAWQFVSSLDSASESPVSNSGGIVPFELSLFVISYVLLPLMRRDDLLLTDHFLPGPGTPPTPISTTAAFLYAPLVYVDYKPQDPTKEYQARGMTLITISAPASGPVATRQGDLIIPGTEVAFGGFSTLLGFKSTDATMDEDDGDRDVYSVGMTTAGLQLARAGINDLTNFAKYTFWNPQGHHFSGVPPMPTVNNTTQIYVPGSFSSGSIFYSPYFTTFIMIYFNKMVDSTFYIRYLALNEPIGQDTTWIAGGKNGKGIVAEDVEALVKYQWSNEQKLWESPTGKGGFNYAGNAHPEYFNTQYFPQSLYPQGIKSAQRRNPWYGGSLTAQKEAGPDGKNLLLSWTSQVTGGTDNGVYQIELATLAFDDIPPNPDTTSSPSIKGQGSGHIPVSSVLAVVEHGSAVSFRDLERSTRVWWPFFVFMQLLYLIELGRRLL